MSFTDYYGTPIRDLIKLQPREPENDSPGVRPPPRPPQLQTSTLPIPNGIAVTQVSGDYTPNRADTQGVISKIFVEKSHQVSIHSTPIAHAGKFNSKPRMICKCGYSTTQVTRMFNHLDRFNENTQNLEHAVVPQVPQIVRRIPSPISPLNGAATTRFSIIEESPEKPDVVEVYTKKPLIIRVPGSSLRPPTTSAPLEPKEMTRQFDTMHPDLARLQATRKEQVRLLQDVIEIWAGIEIRNSQITELKEKITHLDQEIAKISAILKNS